jgi:hypothetical protein
MNDSWTFERKAQLISGKYGSPREQETIAHALSASSVVGLGIQHLSNWDQSLAMVVDREIEASPTNSGSSYLWQLVVRIWEVDYFLLPRLVV